jgi:L-alanine-DL-glutamate epimerase-like enolase superfamily enzyme
LAHIKNIYIGYISSPLIAPFVTALRRVEEAKDLVVVLESNTGERSYGSATAVKEVTGEDLTTIKDAIQHQLAPKLLEACNKNLLPPDQISNLIQKAMVGNSSAKCALEIAYYDLFARENQKSLIELLSTNKKDFETCYTVSLNSPETMLKQSINAVNQGFNDLKLKLGHKSIEQDIDAFNLLNDSTPANIKFRLDANQAWTFSSASTFLSNVDISSITMLEQPVDKEDLDGLRKIKELNKVKVFADESAFNYNQLEDLISKRRCDGVVIKLLKTSGFSEAIKMANLCLDNDLEVMVSSMLETKLGVYSSLVFAGSIKQDCLIDLDAAFLQQKNPFDGGFTQKGPYIKLNFNRLEIYDKLDQLSRLDL